MKCKGSQKSSCKKNKGCLVTKKSSKRKSYCRKRASSSECRGTAQPDCISKGCLLASGNKRSFCRKSKNTRKRV